MLLIYFGSSNKKNHKDFEEGSTFYTSKTFQKKLSTFQEFHNKTNLFYNQNL